MAHYPQLSTGCLAQHPFRKRRRARTLLNAGEGGSRFVFGAPEAGEVEWDLPYVGLTDGEAAALTAFFRECEGRLLPFVFADPFANLIARSEEFHLAPWQSDPLLSWSAGIDDPMGTARACRVINGGAAPQAVRQNVNIPGDYGTCFSVWVRSASQTHIEVSRAAGAGVATATAAAGPSWTRVEVASRLTGSAVPSTVSILFPAGATVDLFGAQLEAQPQASGYMKTSGVSGVYAEARFAEDSLPVTGEAPGSWSARVRIRAREG